MISKKNTCMIVAATIICLSLANLAGAAATFDGGGVYTQNFDSIGSAGTAPPTDWKAGIYDPLRNRVDPPPPTPPRWSTKRCTRTTAAAA